MFKLVYLKWINWLKFIRLRFSIGSSYKNIIKFFEKELKNVSKYMLKLFFFIWLFLGRRFILLEYKWWLGDLWRWV